PYRDLGIHNPLAKRAPPGAGRGVGIGGVVCPGPVLPDRVWIAPGEGAAAGRISRVRLERHPAVDAKHLTGDVVVGLQKESHRASDIERRPETAEYVFLNVAIVLASRDAGFGHAGGGDPRADHINADVSRTAALLRQNPSGVLKRGLLC